MKKVVIYQDKIMPYRVGIFNLLSKSVDLTVAHADEKLPEGIEFKTVKTGIKKIRGYTFLGKEFKRLQKESDAVILPLTPGIVDTRLKLKSKKHIFWGIGVPAAYNCRFDSLGDNDTLAKLSRKANCCLFYSDYPIKKYDRLGFDTAKMFVANNTVCIPKIELSESKDSILFVGSLYPQKKIDELLKAYAEVHKENENIPYLTIIGDGSMYDWCKEYCRDNGLDDKVKLLGEIHDEEVLKKHFGKALMCISPDQAGLSVLKSMGYGVPYVCRKDAITGGEIFNIADKENGILYNSPNELREILVEVTNDAHKYIDYGVKAYEYYWANRVPENMVGGFVDAVNYVCDKK